MADWKKQQRADFEASLTKFFRPIDFTPDFTPGCLEPANYEDTMVNAHWHGYQAGQDDLVGKTQDELGAISCPDESFAKREYWKAGARAVIDAVSRAMGVGGV